MAGARRNRASLPGRDGRRAGYRSGWRGEKQQARIYRGGSRTLLLRADDRIAGGRERIFFHAHCGQVCWGAGWIEFAAGGGGDVRRDFLCREPADSRDCGADCVGRAEAEYFWNGDWLWIEAGGGGVGVWGGAGGGVSRFLATLLVNTGALDPLAYVSASLLLVIVAALGCYVPARRAVRVDPMVTLRYQ